MKDVTPIVLQSYYYNVFSGDQGHAVLRDIKYLLTGADIDVYEAVDPLMPYHQLAAATATRNAWDCINGMVEDLPVIKKTWLELVKETYKIWKYNKESK
jgi:hypothetical protein